jgi:hypothetical protein
MFYLAAKIRWAILLVVTEFRNKFIRLYAKNVAYSHLKSTIGLMVPFSLNSMLCRCTSRNDS